MLMAMKHRRKYMDLVSKQKLVLDSDTGASMTLTKQEETYMEQVQNVLPVETLVVFHQLATKATISLNITMKIQRKKQQMLASMSAKKQTNTSRASSWFGNMFNRNSSAANALSKHGSVKSPTAPSIDSDDVALEKIQADLERSMNSISSTDLNAMMIYFTLSSSAQLDICSFRKDVVTCKMALDMDGLMWAEKRTMNLTMSAIEVTDKYTENLLIPTLVKVKDAASMRIARDTNLDDSITHLQGKVPLKIQIENNSRQNTSVRFTGEALELCFNYLCLHELMTLFQVPACNELVELKHLMSGKNLEMSLSSTSIVSSYALSQISGGIADNTDSTIEISFDMQSPKIIIPEECCQDVGYLMLDPGHVTLTAVMLMSRDSGVTSMKWDLAFQEIMMGMPDTMTELFKYEHAAAVVKPFDVNMKVDLSYIDPSSTFTSMVIDINPKISGVMDAKKLSSLLRIYDVFMVVFASSEATESFADTAIYALHNAQYSSYAALLSSESTAVIGNLDDKVVKVVDATKPTFVISISIPEISLTLFHASNSYGLVKLDKLSLEGVSREYDYQMFLDLNSITIEDSSRPMHQTILVHCPNTNNEDKKLVHMNFITISNKRSPYYEVFPYGTSMELNFGKLHINSDANSLLKLRPYYEVILGKRFKEYTILTTEISPKSTDIISAGIELTSSSMSTLSNTNSLTLSFVPTGMCLIIVANTLSMEMLRPVERDNSGTYSLESIVCVRVREIFAKMISDSTFTSGNVRICSFDVDDTRKLSNNYFYRSMFGSQKDHYLKHLDVIEDMLNPIGESEDWNPNNNDMKSDSGSWSSRDRKQTKDSDSDSISDKIIGVKNGSNIRDNNNSNKNNRRNSLSSSYSQDHQNYQVTVSFTSEGPPELSTISTQVNINDILSFVSVDSLLDLSDVAMTNGYAILDLFAPLEILNNFTNNSINDINIDNVMSSTPVIMSSDAATTIITNAPSKNSVFDLISNINVNVALNNPRLVLLEDPTQQASQAIVIQCDKADIVYKSSTHMSKDNEIGKNCNDARIVTDNSEIYVALDVTKDNPHHVVDPVAVTMSWNSESFENTLLTNAFAFSTSPLNVKTSLNDILLAQSIMMRQTLVEPTYTAMQTTTMRVSDDDCMNIGDDEGNLNDAGASNEEVNYQMIIRIDISKMVVVIINDFDIKSVPLFRFKVLDTTFESQGNIVDLSGEGGTTCQVDSYNAKIKSWEPLIEKWNAQVTMSFNEDEAIFKVDGPSNLQVNLTTAVLETIMQTNHSIESRLSQRVMVATREIAPALSFVNRLGVPIVISDYITNNPIFELLNARTGNMYLEDQYNSDFIEGSYKCAVMPTRVNLLVGGNISDRYLPIKHISLVVDNPKKHCIESRIAHTPAPKVLSSSPISSLTFVIEEVYEQRRYKPLVQKWTAPYMPGDPEKYTDFLGKTKRTKESVICPPNWKWQSDWHVDSSGNIGVDIDENGWHYGFDFGSLLTSKKRVGIKKATHYVCRRRWIRTRVPINNHDTNTGKSNNFMSSSSSSLVSNEDPLAGRYLMSHVFPHIDGSNIVQIISNKRIENQLPYSIYVQLTCDTSWHVGSVIVMGPILEGEVFNVPLEYSNCRYISVKAHVDSPWSIQLNFNMQPVDYIEPRSFVTYAPSSMFDGNGEVALRIHADTCQKHSLVDIRFHVGMIVMNTLPCSIGFECYNTNNRGVVEFPQTGELHSGCSCKLYSIGETNKPAIKFHTSFYGYSDVIDIKTLIDSDVGIQNLHFHAYNEVTLTLCVSYEIDEVSNISYLYVYSPFLVLDKSNLHISVRSNSNNSKVKGKSTIRKTYDMELDITGLMRTARLVGISVNADILDLKVNSQNEYTVTRASVNQRVYTDRNYTFSYLPNTFYSQPYIMTSNDDRATRINGKNLMHFSVSDKALVCVLLDKRVTALPTWLKDLQFVELNMMAEYQKDRYVGAKKKIHYSIYGKVYDANSSVILGDNYSRNARDMYVVFVLPISILSSMNASVISQLYQKDNELIVHTDSNWMNGAQGMTLFSCDQGLVDVGINKESSWTSQSINVKEVAERSPIPFSITEVSTNTSYQLAYTVSPLPGIFFRSKVITVFPKFIIVNCVNASIRVRQINSTTFSTIDPFGVTSWHINSITFNTHLQLSYMSSAWSTAAVDVNELGTSSLLLCNNENTNTYLSPDEVKVINVTVKLSNIADNSMVHVILWMADAPEVAPITVHNFSSSTIFVNQGLSSTKSSTQQRSEPTLRVLPEIWTSFGWSNLDDTNTIVLRTLMEDKVGHVAHISIKEFDTTNVQLLRSTDGTADLVITLETRGNGRIIRIHKQDNGSDVSAWGMEHKKTFSILPAYLSSREFNVSVCLASIAVSFVVDKYRRAEVACINLVGVYLLCGFCDNTTNVDFSIHDIQMDNYCQTALYSTIIRQSLENTSKTSNAAVMTEAEEDIPPFLEISFIIHSINTVGSRSTTVCEYFSARMLPISFELDLASLMIFYEFYLDLQDLSKNSILATTHPNQYILLWNQELLFPRKKQYHLIYESISYVENSKIFFKDFMIHPMKIICSFVVNTTEVKGKLKVKDVVKSSYLKNSYLNVLSSLATIDSLKIKIKSFQLTHGIESIESISTRIIEKIINDLSNEAYSLIGSTLFARSGSVSAVRGVKEIFYEPSDGTVRSSQEVLVGLGKQTPGIVLGVGLGLVNTTAALVGTASAGLLQVTGHHKYIRKRAMRKNRNRSPDKINKGALNGFKRGGASVARGLGAGVSGLFSKPLAGAEKEGVKGFMKGLAKGTVGLIVKPVLGLSDACEDVSQGISSEFKKNKGKAQVQQFRPARVLVKSSLNPDLYRLVPIDKYVIIAQNIVSSQKGFKNAPDVFLSQVVVTKTINDDCGHVIFSERYFMTYNVVLMPPVSSVMWREEWGKISHCEVVGKCQIRILFYNSQDSNSLTSRVVNCSLQSYAISLYQMCLQFSYLMGSPRSMSSIESTSLMPDMKVSDISDKSFVSESDYSAEDNDSSISHALPQSKRLGSYSQWTDGYIFGTANHTVLAIHKKNLTEKDLIKNCSLNFEWLFDSKDKKDDFEDNTIPSTVTSIYHLHESIDNGLWNLVFDWNSSHTGFHASKCCVALLINRTPEDVHLGQIEVIRGRKMWVINCIGYDANFRMLRANGYMIVVICGYTPSIVKKGDVKLVISSDMLEIIVSNKSSLTKCENKGKFNVDFIEKTETEWWSKYVLMFTLQKSF